MSNMSGLSSSPEKTTAPQHGAMDTTVPSSDDVEKPKQQPSPSALGEEQQRHDNNLSTFKSLGFLDRFLAVWIFLAMLVGILLGNFVPNVGPALQKGTFVGVSVPIGWFNLLLSP